MKKFTLMAAALLAGSFVHAADVKVEPEKNAEIVVWESPGAEGEFIKYAAKEFEKKYADYGVKVKFLDVEAHKTIGKMEISAQGGGAADVFVFPHDGLGEAVNSGIIMPNLVAADTITQGFIPAAAKAATYKDGKMYGFPLAIETYAMFYNKKLINAPDTFEYLLKAGTPFTNAEKKTYGLYYDVANYYNAYAFFSMYGGYTFGNNGYDRNDMGLNNKGSVEGLIAILSLKPICPAVLPEKDQASSPMVGLFGEGKVMTIITGPWDIPRVKSSNIDFGIVPLPTYKGKHPISFSGIRLMGVNPSSKYRKASQLFAAFCILPEMLLKRFEITSQIPPAKSLLDDPKIKDNPMVKPFLEQAMYSNPMPSIPEMKLIWDPMAAAVYDAWNGKATPQEALDTAVKTISQQIQLAGGK